MSGGPGGAKLFTLSKNPSNSDKTRSADSSTCTGSRLIPTNSSGKNAPDAPVAAPPPVPHSRASLLPSFPPPVPASVRPSAQHNPTSTRRQVKNHLPPQRHSARAEFFLSLFKNVHTSTDPFALECLYIESGFHSGLDLLFALPQEVVDVSALF